MKSLFAAFAITAGMLGANPAAADPRLDEKVYAPYVQNGVAEFEVRTARQNGGATAGDTTTVLEAEYGLNDRVSLAVVGAIERAPGEGSRLTSIGLEGVAYIGQIPRLGVDTGAYLEYKHGLHGDDDVVEAKLLFAKTAGRFQGLLNLIVERPFGPKGETFAAYGCAASATFRTVGPQLLWEGRPWNSPVEIGLDAGWLFPVGVERSQSHSQLRIGLELERRF